MRGRAAGTRGFFERGFPPITVDVHLEDRRMMDEPVDGGERHGSVWEDFSPFAEGLICGDEQRASLVSGADQLEEDVRFGLILGDVGEIVEDQQMIFVELVDRGFESEVASRGLQSLDEIRRSREENAPAAFDERQAERRRQV